MKRILLLLFALPFLAIGLWFLGSLAGAWFDARTIRKEWTQVPATIVAHESIAIGIHRRFHRPTVRYAYEFEGARYECTRHDLLEEFPIVSTSIGRRGKLPYAVGQAVTAYVDPKAPYESVLSLEVQYVGFLGPFGLLFALIGGAFFIAAVKRYRTGRT